MRSRRSELSTPASSRKMMVSAAGSDADLVFFDLEDSVAPASKDEARANAVWGLTELPWAGQARAVRINGAETEYAYRDVIEIAERASGHVDLLIIPKVRTAEHVIWADVLLTQIEARMRSGARIGLEVLIEDVEALVNINSIARSSPRLEALIFGPGDLAASQGVDQAAASGADFWAYARTRIVVTARAAGLEAIDGPFDRLDDLDGYRREAERSAGLGYTGKWAIHPSQIKVANDAFTPAPDDVATARRLLAGYRSALDRGEGVIAVEGRMIDAASVRPLEEKIRRADAIERLRGRRGAVPQQPE